MIVYDACKMIRERIGENPSQGEQEHSYIRVFKFATVAKCFAVKAKVYLSLRLIHDITESRTKRTENNGFDRVF